MAKVGGFVELLSWAVPRLKKVEGQSYIKVQMKMSSKNHTFDNGTSSSSDTAVAPTTPYKAPPRLLQEGFVLLCHTQ